MTTSAAGRVPDFTEFPSAGGLRASWRFDSDRECDAIVSYVWDQRPSIFRWPFAVTLVVVVVLGVIVALLSGWWPLWIILALLAVMGALVIIMRPLLTRSLRRTLAAAQPVGSGEREVVLGDSGWAARGGSSSALIGWDDVNRWAVWGDDLIVAKFGTRSWVPLSIALVPLSAFGQNRDGAVEFVAARVRSG